MPTPLTCTRCRRPGRLTPVLKSHLCLSCVDDVKVWLRTPLHVTMRHGMRLDRRAQAEQLLLRAKTITAAQVARINAEPERHAYWGLMHAARGETFVHLGLGVFARRSPDLDTNLAALDDAVFWHRYAGLAQREASRLACRYHGASVSWVRKRLRERFGYQYVRGRPRKDAPLLEAAE